MIEWTTKENVKGLSQEMFCFQCEQTAGGKGCTKMGVCGKDPKVAALQDLLVQQAKGIGYYATRLIEKGKEMDETVGRFVYDIMFTTLTNVNFEDDTLVEWINKAQNLKDSLREELGEEGPQSASFVAPQELSQQVACARSYHVLAGRDALGEDLVSLRELAIYGLKGYAAYGHHAAVLGYRDADCEKAFLKFLAQTLNETLTVNDWVGINLGIGEKNLRVMELLDAANTGSYGNPEPTKVNIHKVKGRFIVISGHDLRDLKMLLEQTKDKGINVYTHGEMLPCHGYPELKKYPHLVGNYGGAWQDQQKEFDGLPGAILMTTNCIQKPRSSYEDRLFTSGVVQMPHCLHIQADAQGNKDFTPVIEKALSLPGFLEDEPKKEILTGFGHKATLSHAGEIVEAVKEGKIRHFFLIGGCDGAKSGRNYFTDFALSVPKDAIILTLACGKYRFNKLDFGTVAGLPRLLDCGQCNDAFSAIKVAGALAEAFDCGINDLPLSMILSWYEQKAVVILLTLLSLNIKNIKLGPSLPAFLSPNVLNVLVENFNIAPITNAQADLQEILG
ncbi:Hydroxylamine reductase [Clostridiaceae bacterium JG1575]|nr:Hydroxylamine reductase [Clostridiaceae bacterium JG1575]